MGIFSKNKNKVAENTSAIFDVNKLLNVANQIKFYQQEIQTLKNEINELKSKNQTLESHKNALQKKLDTIKGVL